MDSNRNLLFGILALQMNFISREQLVAATSVWMVDKSRQLETILLEQAAISEEDRQLLAPLVARHVENHDGDPEKSLAAISSIAPLVREELNSLGDAQIEASLAIVARDRGDERFTETHISGVPLFGSTVSFARPSAGESRFRILRPHAKGGLGEVSVAEDTELGREVALKEIQSQFADDDISRLRFVLEAEVTGGLEHPGIVPIYGLGQYDDGRPYYAMRFIRGDSLKEAADRFHGLSPKGAAKDQTLDFESIEFRKLLGRFVDVCNAIEYAHSRGVLHRDLKPGNIMLGKYGETLVVDWGLAKVKGRDDATRTEGETTLTPRSGSGSAPTQMGSAIGTPAFMPPEQAAGRLDALGPASDVYSLGATLYYLLTGQPPVTGENLGEVLKRVEAGEYTAPRNVKRDIPKPLEAICLKAMARSPQDRYVSPQALADDLERYLADERVSAFLEPLLIRTRRWIRKHPGGVSALAATVLVGLISSILVSTVVSGKNRELGAANTALMNANIQLDQKNAELAETNTNLTTTQKQLIDEKDNAEFSTYTATLAAGVADLQRNASATLQKRLEMVPEHLRGWEWRYLWAESDRSVGTALTLPMARQGYHMAFSPDGTLVAARPLGDHDSSISIYSTQTGNLVQSLATPKCTDPKIVFSHDNRWMAFEFSSYKGVRIYDLTTGKPVNSETRFMHFLGFSLDNRQAVLSSYKNEVQLRTLAGFSLDRTLNLEVQGSGSIAGLVNGAFSPDGKRLYVGSWYQTGGTWQKGLRIFDLHDDKVIHEIPHDEAITQIAISKAGDLAVTLSADGTVRVFETTNFVQVFLDRRTDTSPGAVRLLSYEDRVLLLRCYGTGLVAWFDIVSKHELAHLHGGTSPAQAVTFDAEAREVISAHLDGTARRFSIDSNSFLSFSSKSESGRIFSLAYSPDGGLLYTGQTSNFREGFRHVITSDALTLEQKGALWTLPSSAIHSTAAVDLQFSGDGRRILTTGVSGWGHGPWKVFDRWTERALGGGLVRKSLRAMCSAWSADGNWIALGGVNYTNEHKGILQVIDGNSYDELSALNAHQGAVTGVRFSRGNLISASMDGTIRFWETHTFKQTQLIGSVGESGFRCLEETAQPDLLAAGRDDGTLLLFNTVNGELTHSFTAHGQAINAVAFSADGRRCVTASEDRSIKLWETDTWRELLQIPFDDAPQTLTFHPGGQQLAVALKRKVIFLDARPESLLIVQRARHQAERIAAHKYMANISDSNNDEPESVVDSVMLDNTLSESQKSAILRELMPKYNKEQEALYEPISSFQIPDDLKLAFVRTLLANRLAFPDGIALSHPVEALQHSLREREDLPAEKRILHAEIVGYLSGLNQGIIDYLGGLNKSHLTETGPGWTLPGLVYESIIIRPGASSPGDFALACFGLEPFASQSSQAKAVLGMAQCRAGLYTDAIETLEGVEDTMLADAIDAHLVMAYHGLGRTGEASELLAQPRLKNSDTPVLAEARERLKTQPPEDWDDFEASLSVMKALVSTFPEFNRIEAWITEAGGRLESRGIKGSQHRLWQHWISSLEEQIRQGETQENTETKLQAMHFLAEAFRTTGRLDDAVSIYEQLGSLPGQHLDYLTVASLHARLLDWNGAMASWKQLEPPEQYNRKFLYRLMMIAYQLGDDKAFQKAKDLALSQLDEAPNPTEADHLLQGVLLKPLREGEQSAVEKLVDLVALQYSASNYRQQTICLGKYRLGKSKADWDTRSGDAKNQMWLRERITRRLIEHRAHPQQETARNLTGSLMLLRAEIQREIDSGRLGKYWWDHVSKVALAKEAKRLLEETGFWQEAKTWMVELKEAATRADALRSQAEALVKEDKIAQALECYEQIAELPGYELDLVATRELYPRTMQWERAIDALEKINDFRMGFALYEAGHYDEYHEVVRKHLANYKDFNGDWRTNNFFQLTLLQPVTEDLHAAVHELALENAATNTSYRHRHAGRAMYRLGRFTEWYAELDEDSPVRKNQDPLVVALDRFTNDPSDDHRRALELAIDKVQAVADRQITDGQLDTNWREYLIRLSFIREARRVLNESSKAAGDEGKPKK